VWLYLTIRGSLWGKVEVGFAGSLAQQGFDFDKPANWTKRTKIFGATGASATFLGQFVLTVPFYGPGPKCTIGLSLINKLLKLMDTIDHAHCDTEMTIIGCFRPCRWWIFSGTSPARRPTTWKRYSVRTLQLFLKYGGVLDKI
jgi:hypothetical protein